MEMQPNKNLEIFNFADFSFYFKELVSMTAIIKLLVECFVFLHWNINKTLWLQLWKFLNNFDYTNQGLVQFYFMKYKMYAWICILQRYISTEIPLDMQLSAV